MSPEISAGPSSDNLRKLVLEAITKSPQPLNASSVLKNLPKMYRVSEARMRQILEMLQSEGAITAWAKVRGKTCYATQPVEMRVREVLLASLGEQVPSAKLRDSAARSLKGFPAGQRDKLINSMLRTLVDEQLAVKYPRSGERYGAPQPKRTLIEALRDVSKNFPGIGRDEWQAALDQILERPIAPPGVDLDRRIQRTLLLVQPRATEGAVGWLPDVRARLSPPVAKRDFDEAVLALARRDVLSLHEFRGFLQVSEKEREQLVFDGKGNYYGGVAFVRPESV